jgi:hypothetical protein
MKFTEENEKNIKKGYDGEDIVREWFKSKRIGFMQVDLMFKHNNEWYLGEIKSQERFLAPPFDGHGLPEWQINTRINFYNDTKIKPILIVYDVVEKCIYMGNLLALNKGEKFKTKGRNPRVIFPLTAFKKIDV